MPSVVLRSWKTATSTLILALLVTLGTSPSARAHESISEQYPEANQTITPGTVEFSLVFTGELLVLNDASGIEVELTDPSGQQVRLAERGCLIIENRSIQASLDLDQAGEYRVSWQVTAGDGHPLSEDFSFFVENTSNFVAEVPLTELNCSGNVLPDGSVIPLSGDAASEGSSSSQQALFGVSTNVWLAMLLATGLGLIAALSYLLLKPGRSRANRK